ncbi:hypothetical protein [Motilimonas eburnea]|uniref:hypothetical protein n=1 Tax=Motilimonas eburnea TaxID=1737488 RepID=UPI001E5FC499|nr:hypothetical protein [Motilimonas eburnea]MCE2573468.1 hypothetical protein [Motilimonas eburnea]
MLDYQTIDIPFHFRHLCWLCGEPCHRQFRFPANTQDASRCEHAPLILPCCQECLGLAKQVRGANNHIADFRAQYKKAFARKYQKHLAIGKNWTKQELEQSELSGKAFAGFKKSAWMMFEIAQQRLLFQGWSIQSEGQEMLSQPTSFCFDGEEFVSLDAAIESYAKRFFIEPDYLAAAVSKVGAARFAVAVRFCRLSPCHLAEQIPALIDALE